MRFESHASPEFWECYAKLPPAAQLAADKQFALFALNPAHPSLHLKPVGALWSVRVTAAHRALAVREDNRFYWFWIGDHAQYERLLG